MSITIKDIAKEAGVGKSTISRVINGTGYVSPKTYAKVMAVIKRYNYCPSSVARNLSKQESDTIGLIIPEVNNPFFAEILRGVSQMLDKCGYTLILCGSDNDPHKDYRALQAMYAQRIKGLIYVPAEDYTDMESFSRISNILTSLNCPVVLLDRPIARMSCDCVLTDNFSGAYTATEALIHAGHRKIGIVAGNTDLFIGRERFDGYRRAMQQNQLQISQTYIVDGKFDRNVTYTKIVELIDKKDLPTAFFISNNLMEEGFLAAVREKGLNIPDDIAFVGFDYLPGQDIFGMPYSFLDREVLKLGQQAAQLLFRRFEEPDRPFDKIVILPRLRLRGSEKLVKPIDS